MSYGGGRKDSYGKRDYYDRSRHGSSSSSSYQSRSYGNGGGDRRDYGGRGEKRSSYYGGSGGGGGRGSSSSRGNFNGGGRESNRNAKICSFKLFGIDNQVGPCHFIEYFEENNLKYFYVDCCAPNEFVFASRDEEIVRGLRKHFESLNGSVRLPAINDPIKFSLNKGDRVKQDSSFTPTQKRGFSSEEVVNPTKRRRLVNNSEFD